MTMSLKKLLLAVAVTTAGTCGATPAFAKPIEGDVELGSMFVAGGLTADAAAARARKASPDVWRKAAELEAAIAGVDAAKLARLPRITNKLTYTRLSKMDEPDTAALGGFSLTQLRDHYSSTTQIVVPLSDYVLRHPGQIGAAERAADAARTNVKAGELSAAHAGRLAYYEWIRAQLQLVISQRQLAQVRANLDQIRATVVAGRLPKADLLRIESQEAEVEQLVDQLTTLASLREEMLRLQIGARADERLTIGEDVRTGVLAPGAVALDDLTKHAAQQRLDLRAVSLQLAANEERRDAEKANRWPTISAFATTEYANPNSRAFPQEDKWDMSWTAGLQLTYTMNDALISKTTSRKLSAEAKALKADREAIARDIRIDVLSAQQDIANAQRAITTTAKGLDAAEESYRVRRALLSAERVTAVELVDAETDLTRARISALDARIDLRIAIAGLEHALGNDR
jgi:outer membrane protein TolC